MKKIIFIIGCFTAFSYGQCYTVCGTSGCEVICVTDDLKPTN